MSKAALRPDERLLIVRVGAMGDILHALPALAALRAARPWAHLGWVVDARWAALLAGAGALVDRIHLVSPRAWKSAPWAPATRRSITRLRAELHAERYDGCVDLQGSIRSATISRLSGAPRRLGPAHPREWPARLLYRQAVPLEATHVIAQAAELLGAAVGQVLEPERVQLPADAAAERWAEAALSPRDAGFALLVPTAGWGAKQWPAERFAAVARTLRTRGLPVLVNAAGPDDPAAAAVVAGAGRGARVVVSSVPELIALTRRAALVIGGDTGPVHLGAALGRPTVALFGPTDPRRNGPAFPGARATVLRDGASVTDHRRHRATEAGLGRITVEEVVAAALALGTGEA